MYEKFAELLEKTGTTTYQVAKATGISTASFTAWKQGKYNFKQNKLQKIADYFGVGLDYFTDNVPGDGQSEGYYVYGDTAKAAQSYFDDPMTRALFDARQDARPEDVQLAIDLLNRLKGTNPDG